MPGRTGMDRRPASPGPSSPPCSGCASVGYSSASSLPYVPRTSFQSGSPLLENPHMPGRTRTSMQAIVPEPSLTCMELTLLDLKRTSSLPNPITVTSSGDETDDDTSAPAAAFLAESIPAGETEPETLMSLACGILPVTGKPLCLLRSRCRCGSPPDAGWAARPVRP